MKNALAFACAASLASPLGASDFSLSWPVACTLGEDCYIQQYVDHDAGPGGQDFLCQGLTYDGHKGTDIAVASIKEMTAGITVLAAADGVVRGLRNSMEDVLYSAENAEEIAGRECGNGVVIAHENGWETQYCHLKKGSIRVRSGEAVTTGTPLGEIGLSGQTQFPHLHLSVRQGGEVIDPFAPEARVSTGPFSCTTSPTQLWTDTVPYEPGGLLAAGFSTGVPDYSDVKAGTAASPTLSAQASALVFWAYAFGGRANDTLGLVITGPEGGEFIHHSEVLPKAQSQFFRAAGKRLRASNWPSGLYTGIATLQRDGQTIDTYQTTITVE